MITLCPTQITDLDYVLNAEHSPENTPYVSSWSREQHIEALMNPDSSHFTVVSDTASQVESRVGYTILQGLTNPNKNIELMRLVITQKGQGYGRGAIELIKEMAFNKYYAHRLWLDVKDFNYRAQSLYRSVGFVLEGTLRECLKTNNGYESLQIMSILDREYQAQPVSIEISENKS